MKRYLEVLASFTTTILIVLVTFALYYPSLNYDFMWDDFHYLSNNIYIQSLNWDNIQWMLTSLSVSNWHPLTWFSFALDYTWQGELNPWGFHLSNIILHSLNSVGIFFLTILLINAAEYGLKNAILIPQDRKILFIALIAGLLFAIHPQHIESVAWISERKDVLCQFFLLLTITCYIFYTRNSSIKWYWFFVALLFFVLSLMSKPMAVSLPIILLLLDVYPLHRTRLTQTASAHKLTISWPQVLIEKIPFILLSITSVYLTLLAQKVAIISIENFSIVSRIINAINSIFLYISKFFLPIALSPLYPFPDYLFRDPNQFKIIALVVGFLLVTALSVYFWTQKKYYFLISWIFYLVTLLPMSGIIQVGIQAAADRYAYLPTVPLYILVGSTVIYFYDKKRIHFKTFGKFTITLSTATVFFILFILSRNQLQIWKHGLVFWNYVVTINPTSAFSHHNLASHYFGQQNYIKALEHVQLAVMNGYPLRREQGFLGEIFVRLNRFDEALESFKSALKVDTSLRNYRDECIRYNLGWVYTKKGIFEEALKIFETVPSNTKEYSKAQTLSVHVGILSSKTINTFIADRMNTISLATLNSIEYEQAQLSNILEKQGFSLCAN